MQRETKNLVLFGRYLHLFWIASKFAAVVQAARLNRAEQAFTRAPLRDKNAKVNTAHEHGSHCLLLQMPADYYYLCKFAALLDLPRSEKKRVVGYWPYNVLPISRDDNALSVWLKYLYSQLIDYCRYLKWRRLYKHIGVTKTLRFGTWSPLKIIVNLFRAMRIFKSLGTKESLERLSLDGLLIGDLIYDTYLRFVGTPTVVLEDKRLLFIVYKALEAIDTCNEWQKKFQITSIVNSYATYTHHGIVARYFLRTNSEVLVDGNVMVNFKRLSPSECFHTCNFREYKNRWRETYESEENLQLALSTLKKRFDGVKDPLIAYMNRTSFSESSAPTRLPTFDGVMYLHDFVDSPHVYGNLIFPDFWEWAMATLAYFQSSPTKLAIKPHPNQRPESLDAVCKLRGLFPNFIWLDAETSNNSVFSNFGVRFGLSVYGSVLAEMAYAGIVPIAAGEHPAATFDIAYTPKSRDEYFTLLDNAMHLKMPSKDQREVGAFFYMHAFQQKSVFDFDALPNLRFLDPDSPDSLTIYLNKIRIL